MVTPSCQPAAPLLWPAGWPVPMLLAESPNTAVACLLADLCGKHPPIVSLLLQPWWTWMSSGPSPCWWSTLRRCRRTWWWRHCRQGCPAPDFWGPAVCGCLAGGLPDPSVAAALHREQATARPRGEGGQSPCAQCAALPPRRLARGKQPPLTLAAWLPVRARRARQHGRPRASTASSGGEGCTDTFTRCSKRIRRRGRPLLSCRWGRYWRASGHLADFSS